MPPIEPNSANAAMAASTLRRKIGIVIAVAALCVAVGGCSSDMGASTTKRPEGAGQLRYFGGPKSPMWSSQ
jgi:hypothetical protein